MKIKNKVFVIWAMKLFSIFIFVISTLFSHQVIAQVIKDKIVVHYVPWRTTFKGIMDERTIKEMNNSTVMRDSITNDSVINAVKYQLTQLEKLNEPLDDGGIDVRMVCVLFKKDSTQQMFSFDSSRKVVRMHLKLYYPWSGLLKLIEGSIKPHPENRY